jgi:Initiator Replication protein
MLDIVLKLHIKRLYRYKFISMKKEEMSIKSIQNDSNYIILSNPFASPKFIKAISKTENKEITVKDIYSRKLFYEIVSRLKPEHLENIKINENIFFDLEVKEFAFMIGAGNNNNFYTDIKNTAEYLANIRIPFLTKDGKITTVGIVSKTKTDEKGKLTLFIDSEMAEKMLEIDERGNFSFLKEYIFKLQNGQAIKLYPFFKRWANHKEPYFTDLERFKEQFGYNTNGYKFWGNFESRVLIPAIAEINLKTDIVVNYKATGDNLEGARPRVKGLIFIITSKKEVKQLPNGERHQTPQPQDEQTHISNIIPQVIPTQQKEHKASHNQPSQAEIIELGEKAKLTTPQIEKIQELYRTNIRAWEAIKAYLTAPNKATIQNQFAYIIDHKSINTLGVGIWETEKEKAIKRQKHEEEQRNAQLHEAIKEEYSRRKKEKFLEFYNQATEQEKKERFGEIKNNPIYNSNGYNFNLNTAGTELNRFGIEVAGAILAENRNYGLEVRQNEFREEMFRRFNVMVSYDENDIILIIPNLFQEQKPIEQAPLLPHSPEKEIKNEFSEKEKIQNLKKYEAKKRQPKKIEDKKSTKAPTEREAKQPEPQEPAEPIATASQPTEQEQTTETPIIQQPSQANNSNDEPLHIGNLLERTFSKFFKK